MGRRAYWDEAARRMHRPELARRIATVVDGIPESDMPLHEREIHAWFNQLGKTLTLPFPARVGRGADDCKRGEKVQVQALVDHHEFAGVIVKCKHGKRRREMALCRLEAVGRQSENALWLDAYRLWRDTEINGAIDDVRHEMGLGGNAAPHPADLLNNISLASPDDAPRFDPWDDLPFPIPFMDDEADFGDEPRETRPGFSPIELQGTAKIIPPPEASAPPPGDPSPPIAVASAEPPEPEAAPPPPDSPVSLSPADEPSPLSATAAEVPPDDDALIEKAPPTSGAPIVTATLPPVDGTVDHLSAGTGASPEPGTTATTPPMSPEAPPDAAVVEALAIPVTEAGEESVTVLDCAEADPLVIADYPTPSADGLSDANLDDGQDTSRHDPFVGALRELERVHREREAEIEALRRELREQTQCAAAREQEALRLRDELAQAHAELESLRQRVTTAEEEAKTFCDLADDAKHDRDFHVAEHRKLQNRSESLAAQLAARNGQPEGGAFPLPTSYDAVPAWVEEHLAGKLLLLPRALRGLAEAQFHDVGLVCRALLLLANEYRAMRRGEVPREAFDDGLEALRLHCSQSVTPTRAGEEGDEYFIHYPPGTLKRRFLELHLRNNGGTRYPPRCLAIYFLWDETTGQVAVGWLPGHLDIRSSN